MELKEFIKESLSQIIDAVIETQDKYKETNVLICLMIFKEKTTIFT